MSSYRDAIIEDTGCSSDDAVMIEHILREDIFHSTLDWQTRAELRSAARKAVKILAEDRPVFEDYFARTRGVFEAMNRNAQQSAKT